MTSKTPNFPPRPNHPAGAPPMRKTKFKDHADVTDALYRLIGQLRAIQFILDPLITADDWNVDRPFAVRMVVEAMQRDVDDLMEAADEPNPVLVLRTAGDDDI